jgi:preprotein translocase subunit SecA
MPTLLRDVGMAHRTFDLDTYRQTKPTDMLFPDRLARAVSLGARLWDADARLVNRIVVRQRLWTDEPDDALRREIRSLKYRAAGGARPESLIEETFALVREASRRRLGMEQFPVQLRGGIGLVRRSIVEMQTGEGKTLVAIAPLVLEALYGKGAHLATANDYLAARDAATMKPVFEMLGLTVGVVEGTTSPRARRQAYLCDVIYGSAKEFGFDFLRDRLAEAGCALCGAVAKGDPLAKDAWTDAQPTTQRPLHSMLVDEADSLLIDDARTPLVISLPPSERMLSREALYRWAADVRLGFRSKEHYVLDETTGAATLTFAGRQRARTLPSSRELSRFSVVDLYEAIERALFVDRRFLPEKSYVVRDGELVIVDESTGRLAEGRKWQDGIQQAIEARDGLAISDPLGAAARVSVQDFFLRYPRLSGMTGTARSAAGELRSIYKLRTTSLAPNRPNQKIELPSRCFATEQEKLEAIVASVSELRERGRPILVGVRSIDLSERLAALLIERGIESRTINARRLVEEADVVAQAGEAGRVTVATNMAGRGTDIRLDPQAHAAGGLHVLIAERNESPRIDRQLVGRCGRQGDPGSYQFFHSLEDEILSLAFGPAKAARIAAKRTVPSAWPALFAKAQRLLERRGTKNRKELLAAERWRAETQKALGQDPFLDLYF